MLSSATALCKFDFLTATTSMASLQKSSSASSSSALRRPGAGIQSASLTFGRRNSLPDLNSRFTRGAVVILKENKATSVIPAASEQDQSETSKRDDAESSPPFLTILAGLIVFSAICWVIGSIVLWVIGFIVHPPPLPK